MFEAADKERYEEYKFQAGIHGVDIENGADSPEDKAKTKPVSKKGSMIFRAPEDYEGMTDQERQEETKRMMKHWKNFSLVGSPKR